MYRAQLHTSVQLCASPRNRRRRRQSMKLPVESSRWAIDPAPIAMVAAAAAKLIDLMHFVQLHQRMFWQFSNVVVQQHCCCKKWALSSKISKWVKQKVRLRYVIYLLGLLERYEPMAHMVLYINWRFTYLLTWMSAFIGHNRQCLETDNDFIHRPIRIKLRRR